MAAVNAALTALCDLVLGPLGNLPPLAGLAVVSLVTALAVLLAFKWTADQQALARTKRTMQAAVFEMRLFNDDLAALFRAQGEVLRLSLRYLRLSLVPTLWLLVPLVILLVHMQFHFGYTGVWPGQAVLVKARLDAPAGMAETAPAATGGQPRDGSVRLEAPGGIRVETPAVVVPSAGEVAWRIRPETSGSFALRVHARDAVVTKTLVVSGDVARRSPVRPASDTLAQLLHPSERPVPDHTGLAGIAVEYPERPFPLAGRDVGWIGVYLGLTFVFAFALEGVLGVTLSREPLQAASLGDHDAASPEP
jgi:hypothetical protein